MKQSKLVAWALVLLIVLVAVFMLVKQSEQNQTSNKRDMPVVNAPENRVDGQSGSEKGGRARRYVGAGECKACHLAEFEQWQESHHFKAMQLPTARTVLGDFSGVEVNFHGIRNRLYQSEGKYRIDTNDAQGKPASFEIKYTFGFYPLQQYLIELEQGRIQALNLAWDSRTVEDGGQQWFHLQPNENITSDHPFYWTNHFQNWNSRCADCHSTNLQRNYSVENNSFSTTFSEVNVACEACHGAGSQHVELAQSSEIDQDTGFDRKPSAALSWKFSASRGVAEAVGEKNQDDLNMCGACHALRSQLVNNTVGRDFHDGNRLQLLNEGTYFADGQTKEEAFVAGSFLQSKMHHKGVTCGNCHNPHTGKVLAQDNSLCAQCHKPQVFDTEHHHHHKAGTRGSECVNCHMPEREVMQVDKRRDHSFTIPRPELSLALDVPNACTQCHTEQDNAWAHQQTKEWGVKPSGDHWAHLLRRTVLNDVLVTRPAVEAIMNTGLPDLIRASLLQNLAPMPSRVSAEVAQKSLYDPSPLVRRAAVVALQAQAGDVRWQILSPFLNDPNRAVRTHLAEVLADLMPQLGPAEQLQLAALITEYRQVMSVSADAVSTQLNLANLEMRLGNLPAAEKAYNRALIIEPAYVPALLSLADFYRRSGRTGEERTLLEKALAIAPDSGAAQHSFGLYYVRQQEYASAMTHLKLATEQLDASPYYDYVYSVALENQGRLKDAVEHLKAADQRWPNQYELISTLILYLEKSGNDDKVLPYLSKLSAIAPNAPAVQEMIKKHRGEQ